MSQDSSSLFRARISGLLHLHRLLPWQVVRDVLERDDDEVAYTDAFDWGVQRNVGGMDVHALGDLMTTKPYLCGGAYINRMGDVCGDCAFNPRQGCPITSLYWAFLSRHREDLGRVQRAVWSLDKRGDAKREHDAAVFDIAVERLRAGEALRPRDLP